MFCEDVSRDVFTCVGFPGSSTCAVYAGVGLLLVVGSAVEICAEVETI